MCSYYRSNIVPRPRMGCLSIGLTILAGLAIIALITALIISFIASTKTEIILDGHRISTVAAAVGERRAHFSRVTSSEGTYSQIIVYPRDGWDNTITPQDLQSYAQHLSQNESFQIINSSDTTGVFSAVKQVSDGRFLGVQVIETRGTITIIYALTDGMNADSLLNQFGGLGNILGGTNEDELRERARELTEGMSEEEIRNLINIFLGR